MIQAYKLLQGKCCKCSRNEKENKIIKYNCTSSILLQTAPTLASLTDGILTAAVKRLDKLHCVPNMCPILNMHYQTVKMFLVQMVNADEFR